MKSCLLRVKVGLIVSILFSVYINFMVKAEDLQRMHNVLAEQYFKESTERRAFNFYMGY